MEFPNHLNNYFNNYAIKLRLFLTLFIIFSSILLISNIEYVTGDDLIILGQGHAPMHVSDSDSGRFDFSNDGLADYYVKAHYTGNENQLYKVEYKIQDECVDGDSFNDAKLKIGFTTFEKYYYDRVWLTENITVWNPWFKSDRNNENKFIDLVYLSPGKIPIPYPSNDNGEDIIQGIENKKHGSFSHKDSIKELDGQPGWQGSIFFNAPKGDYYLWTIHPATGLEGCDTLAALGIPIIIK